MFARAKIINFQVCLAVFQVKAMEYTDWNELGFCFSNSVLKSNIFHGLLFGSNSDVDKNRLTDIFSWKEHLTGRL